MNKLILLIALTISGVTITQAQTDTTTQKADTVVNPWKLTALYGANGTQSSFVNWNAGGRNNISLMGYISASGNYLQHQWKWDNDLSVALGGLQYIGIGNGGEGLQKTDDRIEISSAVGYSFNKSIEKKQLYLSLITGFRTQFLDGFIYPNTLDRVSSFMAPGYFNLALGLDYSPNKNLTLFISPAAMKWTVVNDQILADAGSFGVDPAAIVDGVLIPGSLYRSEFGAYFKMKYNKEIVKNIEMKSTLELFSNYLENPGNIDVNGDVLFTFKVNKWFSASLNWTVIYDHDINIQSIDGGFGPRTQFKSVLGLGVSYTMKNFVDPPKKN
ncbi:MAG: hypothetical protein ACJA0U_000275 [Salibacteraceae bacterium]|jgi:hypothetical protein